MWKDNKKKNIKMILHFLLYYVFPLADETNKFVKFGFYKYIKI